MLALQEEEDEEQEAEAARGSCADLATGVAMGTPVVPVFNVCIHEKEKEIGEEGARESESE